MFIEKLKENFKENEPIFSNEILGLFCEFTKAYVFRLINASIKKNELIKFCSGVYYIPTKTPFGYSKINSYDVIIKKYIESNGDVYGFFSGITLLNNYGLSNQVPNTIEVVTNKETNISRKIKINNDVYILKKSRTKINKDNISEYKFLELLNSINSYKDNVLNKKIINSKINRSKVCELLTYFPASTAKKYIELGVK